MQKKKIIKTKLEKDIYIPRVDGKSQKVLPYRNSNSVREGLTIPRKELKKLGVPDEALQVGTRFKMAVIIEDSTQMPLIQFHYNKRGGYIPASIVDYHEEKGHLPLPRIKMGDRKRKVDYSINVGDIMWLIDESENSETLTVRDEELPKTENADTKSETKTKSSVGEFFSRLLKK